jgi:hypothetical protein
MKAMKDMIRSPENVDGTSRSAPPRPFRPPNDILGALVARQREVEQDNEVGHGQPNKETLGRQAFRRARDRLVDLAPNQRSNSSSSRSRDRFIRTEQEEMGKGSEESSYLVTQ